MLAVPPWAVRLCAPGPQHGSRRGDRAIVHPVEDLGLDARDHGRGRGSTGPWCDVTADRPSSVDLPGMDRPITLVVAVAVASLAVAAVAVAQDFDERPFTFAMPWWQDEGLRPSETRNTCIVFFWAEERSPRWVVSAYSTVDVGGSTGFAEASALLHLSVLGDGSEPEHWQWFIQEKILDVLSSRLQHLSAWSASRRSFDALCRGMSPSAYDCALAVARTGLDGAREARCGLMNP